jgi:acyl-CoA thioesterase
MPGTMDSTQLAALLARTPFTRFLGHRLVAAADGAAELELPLRREFVQEAGRVHGGVLTSLADSAAVYALLSSERWDERFTGVEMKLNFLRPPALDGPPLTARARIVQQGRRVAVCDVEIAQAEKLCAKGLFTYLAGP